MKASKWLVYATGIFFLGYGILFTLFPIEASSFVTGGSPQVPSGITDMRATYGGMSIAASIIMFILGSRNESLSFGLSVVAITLYAMAFTRLLGMMIDGDPNVLMYLYFVGEITFATLAMVFQRKHVTT